MALGALLLLQLTIGSRDWLASRFPAIGAPLTAVLAPLGLEPRPLMDVAALTIESFELQPSAVPSLYAMNALLRNRGTHIVAWPALELSLLDDGGTVIARRVLPPTDYLDQDAQAQALRAGVGPRAETPLQLALEVRDLAPTGYRVRLVKP